MSEIPRQSAGLINFIGQTGQQPLQFRGVDSVPFNVGENLPDRTQQFQQRIQQSQDEAFNASLSVIESSGRRAQAEALSRTQNNFAGGVAEIAQTIFAGVSLYQENKKRQQDEQAQLLAAMLERDIRNEVIDLQGIVTREGQDNGEFTAFRNYVNELNQYSSLIPQEQLLALQNIGYDALEQVSRRRASNKQELLQQSRSEAVQNRVADIELFAIQEAERVRLNRADPQQYINNVVGRVNELEETGNYSALELARIYNQVIVGASENLQEGVRNQLQLDERLTRSRTLVQRLQAIEDDPSLSPTQRAAEIATLQVEANNFGLGLTLSNTLPSKQELLDRVSNERRFEEQFQNNTVSTLLSTNPQYARHAANVSLAHALTLIDSDSGLIETYRTSENPLLRQVANEADAVTVANRQFLEDDLRSAAIQSEITSLDVVVEKARTRLNPTEALGNLTISDPILLRMLTVLGDERGSISEEEAEAIVNQVARTRQQLRLESDQLAQRRARSFGMWSNRGIDIQNLKVNDGWNELVLEGQRFMDEAHQLEIERLQQTASPQSFREGTAVTAPAVVPLYTTPDGQTMPFAAEHGALPVTSEYGVRVHPVRGGHRFHSGIDIDLGSAPIRSVQGGTVIDSVTNCVVGDTSCGGGWGNFISVRTPTGHVEHYAHLPRDGASVDVGQQLRPGDIVSRTQGNTGTSTGPHLHFTVFSPDATEEELSTARAREHNTVNPRDYFSLVTNAQTTPYGAGLPPTQTSEGNASYSSLARNFTLQEMFRYTPANGGRIETSPDTFENPERVYNNATPRQQQSLSIERSAYPEINNAEDNHGYAALLNDASFREALVQTANRLNIPSVWLADVIELETGTFNPATENSAGAVGLIQFFPGGGLADVANWMRVSESTAKQRLKSMTASQQMHWVERFLRTYGPDAGHTFRTVTDLYGLINQGPSYWGRTRQQALRIRDGNNTLRDLLQRLGRTVGRRYNVDGSRQSSSRRLHERVYGACAECNRQMSNFGRILPHYQEVT